MVDSLFRAYNIRGIYPEQINKEFARNLASAFSTYMQGNKKLVIGRDCRLSGKVLKKELVKGFLNNGKNVVDLDLVPTSLVHLYAIKNKMFGCAVTASHNPPNWNGFKFFNKNGSHCFYGNGLEKVKEIFSSKRFKKTESVGRLKIDEEFVEEYIEEVVSRINIEKKLKVIFDLSNGTVCKTIKKALKNLEINYKLINDKIDGSFPSHSPEPNEESVRQIISEVKKENADLGVFFDADGDRAAFIDNEGRYVAGDLALIIYYLASKNKRIKVVQTVNCTSSLKEIVEENGGKIVTERVGNVFIMERMKKEKAFIGGERSSHFFFKDFYYIDDGLFSALKMIEALSILNKKMSELVDSVNKYYYIPQYESYKINCSDEKKFLVVEKIKEDLRSKNFEINEIDGVKAISKEGWISLRPSNTEPLIKLTVEGRDKESAERLFTLALELVKKHGL
ncbi:MAG: phosphomannomutase/phosphoglucomutase [Candidatus Aenigmarchaeota archaeon]|nr:phosphomannomutase/phosphoglucomutase [Candidatus Aenigmarchaeota archaeon]MDW8149614.1 phosphomannomutase/phosphoglucomutase [Candidatus Aenigmarchaeota archaeon]